MCAYGSDRTLWISGDWRTNAVRHNHVAIFAFLIVLTGAAYCYAQDITPRIGILAIDDQQPWFKPFESTLAKHGWIPGKNIVVDFRNVGGDASRFKPAADELVRSDVQVIFAMSAPAVHAARAASRTVPVVGIDYTTDVVAAGYAKSYARPGQNLTGVFLDAPAFTGKQLAILRTVIPELRRIAVLWDPAPGSSHRVTLLSAAQSYGVRVQVLEVHTPDDIEEAFRAFRPKPQALVVLPSPMLYSNSARLAKLTVQNRLPAISMFRLFSESGGMLSYGPDLAESVERGTIIITRILSGANVGDLPVERPTKYELIVNLKTAEALGIRIPETLRATADALLR